MSLHYWNSVKERRELRCYAATTCVLYMYDSCREFSESDISDTEDEEVGISLLLVFALGTIAKHTNVYKRIEYTSNS